MKKVFDQTVRDLKREVNKKVLKVPGIEQKVLDATSNEPWGPHGSHLADIAQATRNYHEYQIVMTVIWKRINDTGKNWRHVYKSLIILEYLIAHGSERIADEIREHAYQISTLSNFQYIDSGGRDQGSNIRRKSQSLVGLVNDRERIQEVRQKAVANKEKNRSTCSMGSAYKPSSGGYGDPYDNQSEDRCGYRDDDYNSHEKGKDYGYRDDDRYGRDGDKYSRNGDRYGKDYEERCGRDGYRDDDYRGHGNDDYRPGSRRSVDTDRSFDDDDRHSSRSGGGRADGHSHGERLEHQASEQFKGDPPSYDEATRDAQNHIQSEGVGVAVASSVHESSPPQVHKAASPSKSISEGSEKVSAVSPEAPNKEFDAFDEFDPRGSVSAAPLATHSPELDLFGSLSASDSTNSLALLMAPAGTTWTDDVATNFAAPSATSTLASQPYENPFGDSPFTATPQEGYPPDVSIHPSDPVGNKEPFPPMVGFDFGDGLNFESIASSGEHSFESSGFSAPQALDILADILPHTGTKTSLSYSQPNQPSAAPVTMTHTNVPPQPAIFPEPIASTAGRTQPRKEEKFEPKSAVWSDTLSRGLVDLNISGAKTNPLADIGVDFDAINRREKRKEVKRSVTSATTMGKAMGSGSGIGRAPPPHNPMMDMRMGMGMDMGMQPSTMHPPGAGMMPGGGGYNPMMGMNPQQQHPPYGGGYR